MTVGELPVDKGALASARGGAAPAAAAGNALGIVVEDLSGEQRKALGITDNQGVVVQRLAGNLARRSALMPGDVILMVGRKPVKSVADFNASLKGAKPGDAVMLLVRRNEQTQFLAVTVPKDAPASE